ncbi:hypothetical protein ACFYY8_08515 [Streptosporangium sp. NPDC001559]|uniref:hypothetical protein n=1 Tax=Streptosporangium sp. NPDC001559 TaxID=3366187 RepID=UPI0036E7CCA6
MRRWADRVVRERMAVIENSPARRVWTGRRNRRRLVIAGGAALLVLWAGLVVIVRLAPSDLARNVYLSMFALAVAVLFPVHGWLTLATKGVTAIPAEYLDERQRGEQQRAYTGAHTLTTVVLAVLVVLAGLWSVGGRLTLNVPTALLLPLALTLLATHYTLPLLLEGWRLPDPPPDEDD